MLSSAVLLYRRHLEALLAGAYDDSPTRHLDSQSTWDAIPLWLRVRLCWQQGWLDAVYEVSPHLGRVLDLRPVRYLLLAVVIWVGALAAAVLFIAAGLPFDVSALLATTGGGAVGAVVVGHLLRR